MPTYPYQNVADTLRRRIRDGTYPPGSRLPSRTKLVEEFGWSDPVIGAAQRILRQEGLIEGLSGLGVFVVDPLPPRAADPGRRRR